MKKKLKSVPKKTLGAGAGKTTPDLHGHNTLENSISINLCQLRGLLAKIPLSAYKTPLNVFNGAHIGMHVRHIVEFYQAVYFQKEGEPLNYDARKRNQEMERSISEACLHVEHLIDAAILKTKDRPITLVWQGGSFTSSFSREVVYVLEHSIHHMALIKAGLLELKLGELVSADFGVAPSTLAYRKSELFKMT